MKQQTRFCLNASLLLLVLAMLAAVFIPAAGAATPRPYPNRVQLTVTTVDGQTIDGNVSLEVGQSVNVSVSATYLEETKDASGNVIASDEKPCDLSNITWSTSQGIVSFGDSHAASTQVIAASELAGGIPLTTTITVSFMANGYQISFSDYPALSRVITVNPTPVYVDSIEIIPRNSGNDASVTDKIITYVGNTIVLSSMVNFAPANATNKTLTWTSEDTAIASITGDTLYANREGTVKLIATANGKNPSEPAVADDITVEVRPAPVAVNRVVVTPPTLSGYVGAEKAQLTARVEPENASATVTWFSMNPSIATVDENGMVTFLATGTARIRATAGGQSGYCSVTVGRTPIPVTGLTLDLEELSLDIGRSHTLNRQFVPEDANTNTQVVWTSSDEKVAQVVNGRVTGVSVGEATITVMLESNPEIKAECKVTVGEPTIDVTSITLNKGTMQLDVGGKETLTLIYTITPPGTEETDELKAVEWKSSDTSVVTVDETGNVTAVSPGEATITVTSKVNKTATAECKVVVSGVILMNENRQPVTTMSVMVNRSANLLYTTYGAAATLAATWQSEDNTVAYVSGGRITARAVGQTVITATCGNYSAKCTVNVVENTIGRVDVNVTAGMPYSLSNLRTQLNAASTSATGAGLSYVTNLSVSPSQGVLYYHYVSEDDTGSGVAGSARYYYDEGVGGQISISEITFVPKAGFQGTATISYTGFSTKNERFTGSIVLEVQPAGSNSSTGVPRGDINYNGTPGSPVTFSAANFEDACLARTNESLSYVLFSTPSSGAGYLYYNYRSAGDYDYGVGSSTPYYYSGTPNLSGVTFVPASNQVEYAVIGFTGVGTRGTRFEGTVVVSYVSSSANSQDSVITYSTRPGRPVVVQPTHFNELSRRTTGSNLSYIRFTTLPAANQGMLYYNFVNAANPGTPVSTTTRCGLNSTPSLSSLAFVPKDSFNGSVSVPFTAYDVQGHQFKGTLRIQVDSKDFVIRYSVRSGGEAVFKLNDFEQLAKDATGATFDYIQFSPPSEAQGTLDFQKSDPLTTKPVTPSTNYYRLGDTSLLKDVSFTANINYTGTVEIPFNGVNTSGEKFTGRVEIEVFTPNSSGGVRYSGCSLPIPFMGKDFNEVCTPLLGQELHSIQLGGLPDASEGYLYYRYSGHGTGQRVTAGTTYFVNGTPNINDICFVARAGYSGLITLPYTALDSKGEKVSGTVAIAVANTCESSFEDMGQHEWAIPAVEYLRTYGVVNGISEYEYAPANPTLRCEFVTMLCRTFGLSSNAQTSFDDVPPDAYYAQPVAAAKELGITTGTGGNRFTPNAPLTRQDAMVLLIRTMGIVGLRVENGDGVDWSAYSDSSEVADYARSAVGSMIEMGLVQGDGNGILNPKGEISRAEMAVILYRLLTR